MANAENSPYPQWDRKYEAVRDQAEREIEEWYKHNADRGGHAAATAGGPSFPSTAGSWFDRVEEEAKVLYQDVKAKLQDLFNADDTDDDTRAEHERAWNDEAHWQGRLRDSARKLEQEGRFGQPPADSDKGI